MDEGARKQRFNLTLNPDLVAKAESYRVTKNISSLSALVEQALMREMASGDQAVKVPSIKPRTTAGDRIVAFPEIPLFHAAAGMAIASHVDTFQPNKDAGPGRFAVQLHGDSMWPKYPDGSIVILREKKSLKRPVLKQNEIYLFDIEGEKTLKIFGSRAAKKDEVERGISYSALGGKQRVRVLLSINKEFPEILIESDDVEWLGWLDKDDNK